jgi:hypothetical protein
MGESTVMEQQQETESDTDRRIREMMEADMRRAIMVMRVMDQAFGIINRVPGTEEQKSYVRTSER